MNMNRVGSNMRPFFLLATMFVSACSNMPVEKPFNEASDHLNLAARNDVLDIPEPITAVAPQLPPPSREMNEAKHTVVVHDVPLKELLFSLTRDAGLNLDIDNTIEEKVTVNAVNQPLSVILERIATMADIRFELRKDNLVIRKDEPFLKTYRIDYLNMDRTSSSRVSVSTQIASTGQGAVSDGGSGGGSDNSSDTAVENRTSHTFWQSLQLNIASIIGSPIAEIPEGGKLALHPDILFNRESGVLAVKATSTQHKEIQNFLSEVRASSERQVLIEATIVEVTLNDRYQAGIDWNLLKNDASGNPELIVNQNMIDAALDNPVFSITGIDDDLTATLRALNSFGDVSVMSSPKVMALNNQTALLKVVDNLVYFTVDVTVENSNEGPALYTYETDINTVPVGFVMSVTPYINQFGYVTLNIRPTISRVIDQVRDPNPALAAAEVISEIPVIQVREVESILKIPDGEIAIIGGLMQDEENNSESSVPAISRIPVLGKLFSYEDKQLNKSELVILIKPVVVRPDRGFNMTRRSPNESTVW